ncbi:hypothetical protein CAOG_05395 [Capsaspora owczarzaki ATCC 30864]|uniref:BZIP domain-containing protein n=1 Tax=Capsaspora owczarzaki (strain ATCC 30864) TaxID=595528 RepID=A0A0D2VTZ7_CAPO3|nr:hypothetical protein CAOG_05395 [Capsaspora owczarzaki ATCC 30864]KJE94822.1 hypothetical protein CAOG_005395 [Capsaspora owczarzaki ATCC 30864]|eukprot:XP_004346068.1 hypothetical protein CAOG_05395 [Capsaspora owczarzaki ATCC 30864]
MSSSDDDNALSLFDLETAPLDFFLLPEPAAAAALHLNLNVEEDDEEELLDNDDDDDASPLATPWDACFSPEDFDQLASVITASELFDFGAQEDAAKVPLPQATGAMTSVKPLDNGAAAKLRTSAKQSLKQSLPAGSKVPVVATSGLNLRHGMSSSVSVLALLRSHVSDRAAAAQLDKLTPGDLENMGTRERNQLYKQLRLSADVLAQVKGMRRRVKNCQAANTLRRRRDTEMQALHERVRLLEQENALLRAQLASQPARANLALSA